MMRKMLLFGLATTLVACATGGEGRSRLLGHRPLRRRDRDADPRHPGTRRPDADQLPRVAHLFAEPVRAALRGGQPPGRHGNDGGDEDAGDGGSSRLRRIPELRGRRPAGSPEGRGLPHLHGGQVASRVRRRNEPSRQGLRGDVHPRAGRGKPLERPQAAVASAEDDLPPQRQGRRVAARRLLLDEGLHRQVCSSGSRRTTATAGPSSPTCRTPRHTTRCTLPGSTSRSTRASTTRAGTLFGRSDSRG